MPKVKAGDQFPAANLQDIDDATVDFPATFAQAPATSSSSTEVGRDPWCRAQVTAFVYELERYRNPISLGAAVVPTILWPAARRFNPTPSS